MYISALPEGQDAASDSLHIMHIKYAPVSTGDLYATHGMLCVLIGSALSDVHIVYTSTHASTHKNAAVHIGTHQYTAIHVHFGVADSCVDLYARGRQICCTWLASTQM